MSKLLLSKAILPKLIAAAALLAACAAAEAGTYSLTAIDTSLVSGTGTGVSWSGTTNEFDFSIYESCQVGYRPTSAHANGTVVGTVSWTVKWTASYVGETVPDHVLVTLDGHGHHYADAAIDGHPGGPPQTMSADSGIIDEYVNHTCHVGTFGGDFFGSQTDSDLGLKYSGTGSFTHVSGLVYQSTILFDVNCSGTTSCSTTNPPAGATADIANQMKINNIGGQTR